MNKPIKGCLTLFVIREINITIPMTFYQILIRTAKFKELVNIKFWQRCMATLLKLAIFWWNSHPLLVGMQNDIATLMKSLEISYKVV